MSGSKFRVYRFGISNSNKEYPTAKVFVTFDILNSVFDILRFQKKFSIAARCRSHLIELESGSGFQPRIKRPEVGPASAWRGEGPKPI
jgi:hypothetical protein